MSNRIKFYNLRNYKTIPQINNLPDEIIEGIEVVGRVLPFKTNSYLVNELINWDNVPNDPIFRLTFPQKEMLEPADYEEIKNLLYRKADRAQIKEAVNKIRLRLNPNPAGQEHNVPILNDVKLRGIQHKYPETVLFFPTQGQTCHAYCTFCFRWPQFAGMQGLKFAMKESKLLLEYLSEHKEVTDVLFTGGDPMTMSAKILSGYIEPLLQPEYEHIRTIRIGTKSLTYWPYRYLTDRDSEDVIQLFETVVKSGKNLSIQAHFNHPVELSTDAVKKAIARLRGIGAQIRTQSPLLKNINNNPKIWAEMWRKQVDLSCIPYYMFVARNTGSKRFFEIPLVECWQIFRQAYNHVSGLCRTVRGPSMSTDYGKVHIIGVQEINREKVYVLSYIQAREPDWVGIPFFARYDSAATWFDQLQPAFGQEKFFLDPNK